MNYQVAVTLHEGNYNREMSAFSSVDKYMLKGQHILLTTDRKEEVVEYSGIEVIKRNIVRWLLDIVM